MRAILVGNLDNSSMKKTFPTLYKIDTKGRERSWYMEQNGTQYRTVAGLIDGEKVVSSWTTCLGKNSGRANETSPIEQATCEIEADYKKKLKGDYHNTLKEAKNHEDKGALKGRFIKPMLAEKVQDCEDCIEFPCAVQPKLNGARCVAQESGLTSRKGEAWISTPHILKALQPLFKKYPRLILDGELYAHDYGHDLGSTMSLIRKKKPTPTDLVASAKVVQYHVYDLISDGTPGFEKKPFIERFGILVKMLYNFKDTPIKIVYTRFDIEGMEDINKEMCQFLEDGYEGLMVRNSEAPYVFKRSKDLLKYKNFQDDEFEIVDVYEGQGNRSGGCGAFLLKNKDGQTFKSTPKGNREYFKEILDNKNDYIGRQATVKFIELTPKTEKGGGVPYHGVVVSIREDL